MSPRNPNEVLQPDERKEAAGSGEKRVCDEAVGESALPDPKRRKKESWDEERSGRDDDDVLREIGGCQGKVSSGHVTLRDENESHGWDGQGVETCEDSGDECDGERSNSDKVKEDENYYEKRDLDESSEDDQYTARTALMEREEELDEMERQEQRVQMKRQLELVKLCRERAKARVQEGNLCRISKEDMGVKSNLCEACRYVVSTAIHNFKPRFWSRILYHDLIYHVLVASKQGCGLCKMFMCFLISRYKSDENELDRLLGGEDWDKGPHLRFYLSVFWHGPDGQEALYVRAGLSRLKGSDQGYEWQDGLADTWEAKVLPATRPTTEPVATVNDDGRGEMITLAKSWLLDCERYHMCSSLAETQVSPLPTRLLHIDGRQVRLCLSTHLAPDTKYATLSHCWGPNPNPMWQLKKSNLGSWQRSIPQEALSRTFREAIYIAAKLDIEYIWIDSLCIIQEGSEDFEREAVKMAQTYGGSFLNIVAGAAVDGSGGCFPKNTGWKFQSFDATVGDLSLKFFPESPHVELQRTTTASRAWCLQERLLATRTLHFSKAQMYWECNDRIACESSPGGVDSNEKWSGMHIKKEALKHSWPKIVWAYTRCCLTYGEDRLVALAGIIRKMEMEMEDTCSAGIWNENFLYELLWTPSGGVRNHSSIYVAPTWSWASIEGPVTPRELISRDRVQWTRIAIAHVLRVNIVSGGSDFLGKLAGGTLTLLCQTMLQAVFRSATMSFYSDRVGKRLKIHSMLDDVSAILEQRDGDIFYLLPIVTSAGSEGLILDATKERGQYRRMGVFYEEDEFQRYFEDILMTGDVVEDSAFVEWIDDKRYPNEHWVLEIV